MLLIERKRLNVAVDETTRLLVLDALGAGGLRPLIRAARRRAFELSLTSASGAPPDPRLVDEFERLMLAERLAAATGPHTPGDLFCTDDAVFYLAFDGVGDEAVRAGVVYDKETAAPLRRFEQFCRRVREAVSAAGGFEPPEWEDGERTQPHGLARFVEGQDLESVRAMKFREGASDRLRASELLSDARVREYLRREQEARAEGYRPRALPAADGGRDLVPIETLVEAGLMRREVRVTCRKTKHPLFDLPAPDALALVTLSRARCSLCATDVADEIVEEVYNPTRMAAALLGDGSWLRGRVYQIVRDLGVPESEIASGPPSEGGESSLVANVCGELFLFAVRDGELSPAFSRRAIEAAGACEARHVVAVVTGAAEGEGWMRLYEYAWRRARGGKDVDVYLIEEAAGLREGIERVFERAAGHTLARDLYSLDASLGASASHFVLALLRTRREAAAAARRSPPPARLIKQIEHGWTG